MGSLRGYFRTFGICFSTSILSLSLVSATSYANDKKKLEAWKVISNQIHSYMDQSSKEVQKSSCRNTSNLSSAQRSKAIAAGIENVRSMDRFFIVPSTFSDLKKPLCTQFKKNQSAFRCCLETSYRLGQDTMTKIQNSKEKDTSLRSCNEIYKTGTKDGAKYGAGEVCKPVDLKHLSENKKVKKGAEFCYLQGFLDGFQTTSPEFKTKISSISGARSKDVKPSLATPSTRKSKPKQSVDTSSDAKKAE